MSGEHFQGIHYFVDDDGYFHIADTDKRYISITPAGAQFLKEYLNKNV